MDEAVWFDAFFLANIVPIFYVETLADLEKEVSEGKDPEDLVGMLAEKTPSEALPNAYHRYLMLGEISATLFRWTGQIVISAGEVRQSADGSVGVHVDNSRTCCAIRWQSHEFLEIERAEPAAGEQSLPNMIQIASSGS